MCSRHQLKYEAIKRCNIVYKLQSITDIEWQHILCTCNMVGRHKTKTHSVCFKSMWGDHLKRHMKRHERGKEDNIVTKGMHDGKTEDKDEQKSFTHEQFIALKNEVSAQMK